MTYKLPCSKPIKERTVGKTNLNETIWITELSSMLPLVWMKGKAGFYKASKYSKTDRDSPGPCAWAGQTTVQCLFISLQVLFHRGTSYFQKFLHMQGCSVKQDLAECSEFLVLFIWTLFHANKARSPGHQARTHWSQIDMCAQTNWYKWRDQCSKYFQKRRN